MGFECDERSGVGHGQSVAHDVLGLDQVVVIIVEEKGGQAVLICVGRNGDDSLAFAELESVRFTAEKLEHGGKRIVLRLGETIQDRRPLGAFTNLVAPFVDKRAQGLDGWRGEHFDDQNEVEVLGAAKFQTGGRKPLVTGGSADQDEGAFESVEAFAE